MKITILVSGSIRSNFSYRALALARSLVKYGNDVSIIAPKADKYNDFVVEDIDKIDCVKIWQPFQFVTRRPEINLLPYMFGVACRVLKEKPDLVYIYKPTPASIVGLLVKFLRKTLVVLDMDDLGSEVMKIEGHPWHQRKLVESCEWFAARYADRLVVASSYLRDLYESRFPNKPIYLMPNGVDSEWLREVVPSKTLHKIVFMGAVNRKNILEPLFDVLPDVLQTYPDTKVLIIGDGAYLKFFKDRCIELGIADHVEFTGWLKIEEARSLLCAGDIGYNYMPDAITTRAASNMKVPQYMSHGVLPIVSDIGDLAATVDHGKAGYVCKPDDVNAFKAVLIQALGDKNRMDKSRQARAFCSNNFDWDILASGLYEWLSPKVVAKKADGKKIYMVTTSVPGNFGGGEIRNYNLAKQLVTQGRYDLEVFCISDRDIDVERKRFESGFKARCHISKGKPRTLLAAIRAILINGVPPFMLDFRSSGVGDVFRKACEQSLPDIVHIGQPHGYYCIREHISWLKIKGVKIVFDCHNIEYKSFQESLETFSFIKRFFGYFLVSRQKSLEIEAVKNSDVVLACSDHDAEFFKRYNKKTFVIPNGVDCSEFADHKKITDPTLIFMGGVGYPPNDDAMKFYLGDIHPEVKKLVPDIRLLAIGTSKGWLEDWSLVDDSVEALGFVDDIRPYLSNARIGICPIRYGSGTRIKIMTYMAAGLPVVSTRKGAEGVVYSDGKNILLADSPQEFSNAILELLRDENNRYREIAQNGHDFVRDNFDWIIIGKSLVDVYKNETL